MRTTAVVLGFLLVVAGPAAAQQMTGQSISALTGLVTTFTCDEHGDPDCFRYRTELGTIPTTFFTGEAVATTLAPSGELVVGNTVETWVGGTLSREIRLDWLELPSLDVVSSLTVTGEPEVAWDIAFGPDGTLWMTGRYFPSSVCSLYTVDQVTGQASEVWTYWRDLTSIAFVGERMFLIAGTSELLEYDPATGVERLVADYLPQSLWVASLSAFDGRLWSLSFVPTYPPGPQALMHLGTHNLENGDREVLVQGFDYAPGGEPAPAWTLDFANPEQQPAAIPGVGRFGLAAIVVLIGLAGVLLARRVF